MSAPDKCPRCEAGIMMQGSGFYFRCGTWSTDDGTVDQSRDCTLAQRDQLAARVKELEAELERAKKDRNHAGVIARRQMLPQMQELSARVKELEAYAERLEKAGDSLQCAVLGEEKMPHWQWLAMAHEADLKWRSAKETKP